MLDHLSRQASPGSSFSARHTQARGQARTRAHARQLSGCHMKPIPDCYRRATWCNNSHARSPTPRSYKRANSKRLLNLYHSGVTKGSNSGLAKGRTFPSLIAANRQAESEEIPPPPSVDHEKFPSCLSQQVRDRTNPSRLQTSTLLGFRSSPLPFSPRPRSVFWHMPQPGRRGHGRLLPFMTSLQHGLRSNTQT